MTSTQPPGDPRGSASDIRRSWEARAQSPYREFYIASHRGWNDDAHVGQQAAYDAEIVLHGLEADWLVGAHVLEIGCGSGRLARQIAPRVRTYTGFDIAPTMVDVAAERVAEQSNARVLLGSGEGIPANASDRTYALIFSHAVLIHCPREIIGAYVREAWPLLAPGGQLRLQLLAEPSDATGIEPIANAPTLPIAPPTPDSGALQPEEQRDLESIESELEGTYYMGARFLYEDVEPFLHALAPGARTQVRRFEPEHIYVHMQRQPTE